MLTGIELELNKELSDSDRMTVVKDTPHQSQIFVSFSSYGFIALGPGITYIYIYLKINGDYSGRLVEILFFFMLIV